MEIIEDNDSTITVSTGKEGETIIIIKPNKSPTMKKWSPKEGVNVLQGNLEVYKEDTYSSQYIQAGMTGTEKELEQRAKILRRTARLHALACELGGAKEWVKDEQNWYIYKDENDNDWISGWVDDYYEPSKVYMTKECAVAIRHMINSGEVEL